MGCLRERRYLRRGVRGRGLSGRTRLRGGRANGKECLRGRQI